MSEKVSLALYDITQGMAKNMSMMFLGQQVDAVYHSGLRVYGKQYYFGGGIVKGLPGDTGAALEIIQLGETEIPKELFEQYLGEIDHKYTAEKYNLIENNCNHFTDDACQFLIGKGIPSKVKDQAKQLLQTPAGQAFKPFLMQMQGAMSQPPAGFK